MRNFYASASPEVRPSENESAWLNLGSDGSWADLNTQISRYRMFSVKIFGICSGQSCDRMFPVVMNNITFREGNSLYKLCFSMCSITCGRAVNRQPVFRAGDL